MKLGISAGVWGLAVAFAAASGWATVNNVTVTDTHQGRVEVRADLTPVAMGAMVEFACETADGMVKIFNMPDMVGPGSDSWSSTGWNPYLRAQYTIRVREIEFQAGPPVVSTATTTHEITTNRLISGTLNLIQSQTGSYDPNGAWANVDTNKAQLQCIGYVEDPIGGASVGCCLINAGVDPMQIQSTNQDVIDAFFVDISSNYPVGTPFRFHVSLHARPDTFMGMGTIQRYEWDPADTNNPAGPGTLVFDIQSCSPWRSSADLPPLGAHAGFAPIYLPPAAAAGFTGTVMWTSAHYMDVQPSSSETGRVGLICNGHAGSTNYLSVFLSDGLLQFWGVTDPTTQLAGYTDGIMIDASRVSLTRIEGGTNIIFDCEGDGVGDSGYVAAFSFSYPGQAAAGLQASGSSVQAEIGVAVANQAIPVGADFDGDGRADPAMYTAAGQWYIWMSAGGYQISGPYAFGAADTQPVAADFDGDQRADPATFNAGAWTVWMSAGGYIPAGPFAFGATGDYAVAADFDGDQRADPAVYKADNTWTVWLSSGGYQPAGPFAFGASGATAAAADFDADGRSDPAVYATDNTWTVWMSSAGYAPAGPFAFGLAGYLPVAGDFDGDGRGDPTIATQAGTWYVYMSSGGYQAVGPFTFSVP